jgi:hypothetical protein
MSGRRGPVADPPQQRTFEVSPEAARVRLRQLDYLRP